MFLSNVLTASVIVLCGFGAGTPIHLIFDQYSQTLRQGVSQTQTVFRMVDGKVISNTLGDGLAILTQSINSKLSQHNVTLNNYDDIEVRQSRGFLVVNAINTKIDPTMALQLSVENPLILGIRGVADKETFSVLEITNLEGGVIE